MISVIIPTKNRSDKLARALKSVGAQTTPPSEIIVVDDGSLELEAVEIANIVKAAGGRLVRQEISVGAPAARNLGVSASTGKIIAFLDSDDWWAPQRLERHAKVLNETGAVLSYNLSQLVSGPGLRPSGTYGRALSQYFSLSVALAAWNFIGGCSSVCVTRQAYDKVSGFDLKMSSCQDWDLWYRLIGEGGFAFVNDILTFQDVGQHERITTSRQKVEEGHNLIMSELGSHAVSAWERRYIRAHHEWIEAELAMRFGDVSGSARMLLASLMTWPNRNALSRFISLIILRKGKY